MFIGDSGQHDPEIYGTIAKEFPERVKAIYIRNIRSKKLSSSRQELKAQLAELGISLLFIESTKEGYSDAREKGLVD